MTFTNPNIPEGDAVIFTWLADKFLGGAKKALNWGWSQAQWTVAQDRYDAEIIKQYGEIRIFGQTVPKSLRDIFTDVYVLDKPTAYRRFSPTSLTDHLWSEDRSFSFRHEERQPGEEMLNRGSKFFILGKPGAGKTTFLKRLSVREAQRGKWGKTLSKVPIFISLKQFAATQRSLFEFIVDQFAVCHFPDAAPFIEKLLISGQALLLFDGLDEVSTAEESGGTQRGAMAELLEKFASQYNACHTVITCRIAATDYTFDPSFIYLEMSDFAPDQVEKFVRAWFWDKTDPDASTVLANGMLAEWERPEYKGLRDLARNPLLLTLLCLNYAETLSFPARRVEIYEEALDALLKKWDSSRQIQRGTLYRTLSLGRKRHMFARIAYEAFVHGKVLFPQANLEQWLLDYLRHVPELPAPIDIDAEDLLQDIIAQHGIFAEQAQGLFSFAHLTFQEYFAATYIVDNAASGTLETLLGHVTDNKRREVFMLTASLLPDATNFLTAFETSLHRLLSAHPSLLSRLRWLADQASRSQAGYRQPSTRLWYALDSVLNLDSVLDLDSALDRVRDLDSALDFDRFFDSFVEHRTRLLTLSQQQGYDVLYEALLALNPPSKDAPHAQWQHYAAAFMKVIESQPSPQPYRQLQAEIEALAKNNEHLPFLRENIEALKLYLQATRLFYDCLQIAYVSDRRSFEERIFLPPP